MRPCPLTVTLAPACPSCFVQAAVDGPQVPQQMTAEQLRPTFEAYGTIVDITIILDKTSHVSKGAKPDLIVSRPRCLTPCTKRLWSLSG